MAFLLLLIAAACRPAASPSEPSRSDTPARTATPTEVTPPRVLPFDDGEPCPRSDDDRLPAGAGCLSAVTGDLDGDHHGDLFVVFATLDGSRRPTRWLARAITAVGDRADVTLVDGSGAAQRVPRTSGAADADGDGREEAFVNVERGASTQFLEVLALEAGRLVAVEEHGRGRLRIAVGGTVTHGDGGECVDVDGDGRPELVLASATTSDGSTYRVEERVLRWSGREVSLATTNSRTLGADGHAALAGLYELRCGRMRTSG
ncbi:MAG: hypothetical protein ACRDJ4_01750 [Actinomycetota bacterium]